MMIAVPAMAFIFAAVQFIEQDLPPMEPRTTEFPFRQADFNGDQHPDLVTPEQVFLQKDGLFDISGGLAIPSLNSNGFVNCDAFGKKIYLWTNSTLRMYALEEGTWRTLLEQPLERPAPADKHEERPPKELVILNSFLQDIDNDGVPEITAAAPEGMVIYGKKGQDTYSKRALLNVFPPLTADPAMSEPLWPQNDRRVIVPGRSMSCQYVLEKNLLTVISRDYIPERQLQYRIQHYRIDSDDAGGFAVGDFREEKSEPVPALMRPVKLNNDELMDYAGGDWRFSQDSLLPTPLSEIKVSTDGGKTIQSLRTVAFGVEGAFVDVDGDGDLDLVADSTEMFDGGPREVLMRFLTASEIQHEIHIHLQDSSGKFSETPAIVHRFTFHTDAPLAKRTKRTMTYATGEWMSLDGDFDGDGRHDLLLYDKPDQLSVHLNRIDSFSSAPDAVIPVGNDAIFDVVDLNGDGCTDIWTICGTRDGNSRVRLYLARKGD
jgi:hypothetical protein